MEDNRDNFWHDSLIGCFSYIIGILVGLMAAVLLDMLMVTSPTTPLNMV
jgi:hypothetical protein